MYMLRVCVRACACVYGQYDRCWTAIVIDFNAYWAPLPTQVGGVDYWQDTIIKCGMPAMASSVTEAGSCDERRVGIEEV